jgi:Toastrack DUF4097
MTETRSTADPTVRELLLAAGGDLELRLGANRLRIRVTDGERVVIRGRTDHDLERDVEITSGTGWIRVTDGPAGSLRVGPITVRSGGHTPELDIEVPRGVRISARTLSGDIDAIGVAGPSRWQSASGRIRIGAEGGPLSIETMSGDVLVEAGAPLAVTARTVSGSVRARAPRLSATDVATTSGDVTLDASLDASGAHSVTSVSGDLLLVTGSPVTVDLQSVTGDIMASLPHRSDGARGRRTVTVGSGAVRVDVKTMSGDVHVRPGAPDEAPPAAAGEPADGGARPERASFWTEFGRDWAEWARDWARDWAAWGASWSAGRGWTSPGAAEPGPTRWTSASPEPAVPGEPAASADTAAAADARNDAADPSSPTNAGPEADLPSAAGQDVLDDTAPIPAPGENDIDAARLEVLRSLERGDLDVQAASDRLAALERLGRNPEA